MNSELAAIELLQTEEGALVTTEQYLRIFRDTLNNAQQAMAELNGSILINGKEPDLIADKDIAEDFGEDLTIEHPEEWELESDGDRSIHYDAWRETHFKEEAKVKIDRIRMIINNYEFSIIFRVYAGQVRIVMVAKPDIYDLKPYSENKPFTTEFIKNYVQSVINKITNRREAASLAKNRERQLEKEGSIRFPNLSKEAQKFLLSNPTYEHLIASFEETFPTDIDILTLLEGAEHHEKTITGYETSSDMIGDIEMTSPPRLTSREYLIKEYNLCVSITMEATGGGTVFGSLIRSNSRLDPDEYEESEITGKFTATTDIQIPEDPSDWDLYDLSDIYWEFEED